MSRIKIEILTFGVVVWALTSSICLAQGAVPIRFEEFRFSADTAIYFEESRFSADETWYVAGTCKGAFDAPKVHVEEFSFSADLKVHIASISHGADRQICIVNPDDAPDGFRKAYSSR